MATILLVDDNESLLESMVGYLETDGHEVTLATNGNRAIKVAATIRFDLVITDIILPDSRYHWDGRFRESEMRALQKQGNSQMRSSHKRSTGKRSMSYGRRLSNGPICHQANNIISPTKRIDHVD